MDLNRWTHYANIKSDSSDFDFRKKLILAPMVRVSTLPMRLMSLHYGADIVFNQELICFKVQRLLRTFNDKIGLIEYVDPKDKKVAFRTFEGEPLVIQLGTNNAINALKSAEVVSSDAKGIDINMGCPYHFSVSGGMGASLLKKPETVNDIIQTLKRNTNMKISCKVRILPDPKESLDLIRLIEKSGADAITIRPHYTKDKRRFTARVELVKHLTDALSIPTVYNGDIFELKFITEAKKMTGCDSVMIARAAQWNPSVFSGTFKPVGAIVKEYTEIANDCEHSLYLTKYCLQQMLKGNYAGNKVYSAVSRANDYDELMDAIDCFCNDSDSMNDYDPSLCSKDVNSCYFYQQERRDQNE